MVKDDIMPFDIKGDLNIINIYYEIGCTKKPEKTRHPLLQ